MKGKTKARKLPGFTRHVVADNLARLLDYHYKIAANKPEALSKDTGHPRISKSSIQRIVNAETTPNLDTIERIAGVFHLFPYQMFIPGLDVQNPQIAIGPSEREKMYYKNFEEQ